MRKIENVIDSCKDCKHFRSMVMENKSHFYAAICDYTPENEEEKQPAPMLLNTSSDNSRHYRFDIPDNCPLETFKEITR